MGKAVFLCCLLILIFSLAGNCIDFVWFPNSNWDNPNNWLNAREVPLGKNIKFIVAPELRSEKFAITLQKSIFVKSISFALNSRIILKQGTNITFTNIQSNNNDSAVMNIKSYSFHEPANWRLSSYVGNEATEEPCNRDKVIFPVNSSFSWINVTKNVTVANFKWKGQDIFSINKIQDLNEKLVSVPKCVFKIIQGQIKQVSTQNFISFIIKQNAHIIINKSCSLETTDPACFCEKYEQILIASLSSGSTVGIVFGVIFFAVLFIMGITAIVLLIILRVRSRRKTRKPKEVFNFETLCDLDVDDQLEASDPTVGTYDFIDDANIIGTGDLTALLNQDSDEDDQDIPMPGSNYENIPNNIQTEL